MRERRLLHLPALAQVLRVLLLIQALKQSLPALFHFNEPGLQPLPQLVVLSSAHVGGVPHVVLDELLNLVLPARPQDVLLNALHCDHQSRHVLYQHIVSSYQQLLLLLLRVLLLLLSLGRGQLLGLSLSEQLLGAKVVLRPALHDGRVSAVGVLHLRELPSGSLVNPKLRGKPSLSHLIVLQAERLLLHVAAAVSVFDVDVALALSGLAWVASWEVNDLI